MLICLFNDIEGFPLVFYLIISFNYFWGDKILIVLLFVSNSRKWGRKFSANLEFGKSKLKEIEQKFVELNTETISQKKKTKQSTKKREEKSTGHGDTNCSQLADYAVRLVFHFLSKVRSFFIFKLKELINIYVYCSELCCL